MKERPILFSGAMVRALLAGSKTQTRRVVKMKPHQQIEERDDGTPWPWMHDGERDADSWMACPYGQPGDRLWVRESWSSSDYRLQRGPYLQPDDFDVAEARELGHLIYAADGTPDFEGEQELIRWTPSIHMPRWACRITLEITSVRVERLQDISEADALAEGVSVHPDHHGKPRTSIYSPIQAYRDLWEQINGPDSWGANPWVWVVEFKRLP